MASLDRLVIVRDAGDAWQVVLQPDHADLAAGSPPPGPSRGRGTTRSSSPRAGTTTAGRCGSSSPLVDGDRHARHVPGRQGPAHLAFYRAGIAAITDEDAYAGLLVSMHGAGIYRQRYGDDPGLR